MENIDELNGSELGTREFWDCRYEKDLKNYHDFGDPGEVWFGDQRRKQVLNWIQKCNQINKTDNIIDIGCGSGLLLNDLSKNGYSKLTGIDYSEAGIKLAKKISLDEKLSVDYKVIDILNTEDIQSLKKYNVVHDNGTYDAISLNPDNAADKKKKYLANVVSITEPNGLFIITSCNWTEEELKTQFKPDFSVKDTIPSPKFTFGGKTGSPYTTIIFQKEQ